MCAGADGRGAVGSAGAARRHQGADERAARRRGGDARRRRRRPRPPQVRVVGAALRGRARRLVRLRRPGSRRRRRRRAALQSRLVAGPADAVVDAPAAVADALVAARRCPRHYQKNGPIVEDQLFLFLFFFTDFCVVFLDFTQFFFNYL